MSRIAIFGLGMMGAPMAAEHCQGHPQLNPKVEINPVAGVQGAEQRGELGWRGRAGKGGPAPALG